MNSIKTKHKRMVYNDIVNNVKNNLIKNGLLITQVFGKNIIKKETRI